MLEQGEGDHGFVTGSLEAFAGLEGPLLGCLDLFSC